MQIPFIHGVYALSLMFVLQNQVIAADSPAVPCEQLQTTPEIRDCVGKELRADDAELNKVYQQLIGKIEEEKRRVALRKAQHAWIGFRDATCEYEAVLNQGGTIYAEIVDACLASMTERRSRELKEMISREK